MHNKLAERHAIIQLLFRPTPKQVKEGEEAIEIATEAALGAFAGGVGTHGTLDALKKQALGP